MVKEFIMEPACVVDPTTSLQKTLFCMEKEESDYACIVGDKIFHGIFILSPSVCNNLSLNDAVEKAMVTDMPIISSGYLMEDVAIKCFKFPVIPIVENKRLKGVITREDYCTFYLKRCQGTINDLEDKMQLAAQSNQQLNDVMNHSYDGFAITNKQGVTIKVNSAWDRLTGLNRENVLGIPLNELVKKGYFSDSVTMKVMRDRKPATIMQKMKSGKRAMMTGSPIFDEEGEIERVIINIRDMTELTMLKRNLEHHEKLSERYQTEIAQIRSKNSSAESIIANSKSMQDLLDVAYRISRVESTVLLTGESGTGKGVVARYIHNCKETEEKCPFIIVNCGAIPHELLESELFGYAEGAFTGASQKGKPGMFELADGGTLFLDEIAELPMNLQVKLLSVIQEKKLIRVGGTKSIALDVRIIAATNQNLTKLVEENKFREDLFYRLNVIPLNIPPLRSRKEDIIPLSFHYLKMYNRKNGLHKRFSESLMDTLLAYDWPGNIRELANVIERMVVTSENETLTPKSFPLSSKKPVSQSLKNQFSPEFAQIPTLREAQEQLESKLIKTALEEERTQAKAAEKLGISLSTLIRKMNHLQIK